MKWYYVIVLFFFVSRLSSQDLNPIKLDESYNDFVIVAKEKIANADVSYARGKKRKAKKLLQEVIARELSIPNFNGEYSVNAALSLLNIDSILGTEHLIELYRKLSELRETAPDSMKRIYSINIVKIEKKIRELSGKGFYHPYEFIFYFEGLISRNQSQRRVMEKYRVNNQFDSLRVYCFGMGGGMNIIIKQDSFSYYASYMNDPGKEKLKMEALEWSKLLAFAENLDPEIIPSIVQPPDGARHVDGAQYCSFSMFTNGEEFKSQHYDDFWPAEELQPVVYYIRYLLRKKLNR